MTLENVRCALDLHGLKCEALQDHKSHKQSSVVLTVGDLKLYSKQLLPSLMNQTFFFYLDGNHPNKKKKGSGSRD